MPILPTIPTLEGLSYPVKKLLGFAAKNSMQAQGKSEKEIIQDLVTKDDPSFYSEQTRDGGNEIDTYLYGTPYNTENTSNVGPSYENYLSKNFPLRKHAVKTYDTHFGDTLYIDQKYKDQVLDELEQGKTVGASMGRYGHAPSYIVNTKDDKRRPYDAGGHLMQFQYDKDGNVVANMSDIYDFLPRDFEEKYGAIKEYGPLKTAGMYAMHYAGTPFIVRQNNIPVRFKEIVPEYKTELQGQLGNFLSNWGGMYDLTIPHRLTDEQIEEIFDGKQSGDEVLDFMEQKGYLTPVFKKGGRIHIKKKNRGKFTEYCGGKVTEECIAKGKKSKDPKIRKRATFAANARKWKHENGGILKYQNPSSPLLNPHKIIENIPARERGPRKINEDYSITEGKGTNFWRAPFQYLGNKGLGVQNEKLARDLISEFDQMRSENPDYNYTLDKNYQSYDDAVNYLNHLEGLKKYLGLPYDTGLLMESKYKPTRLQGTNEKTYKFKSSTVPGYWNDVVDDMVFGEHSKNQYYDQSLNEFTAYRDRDEKGDFVSIYDEWDYNPAVRGGNKKWNKLIDTLTGGTPFVIYDRVYLDDYYDIPEEARGNPFITPAVVTANEKHENGGVIKAQNGINMYPVYGSQQKAKFAYDAGSRNPEAISALFDGYKPSQAIGKSYSYMNGENDNFQSYFKTTGNNNLGVEQKLGRVNGNETDVTTFLLPNGDTYSENHIDGTSQYNVDYAKRLGMDKLPKPKTLFENGGILKAQEGTGNLLTPHPLSPVGIALNQAKAMSKGKKDQQHLPPGVKEVVGPDGKKVAIRIEQPLVPLEQSIAEWIPGTGDVAEVGQIANDVKNGNYGTAALAAGLMILPGNARKILDKFGVDLGDISTFKRLSDQEWDDMYFQTIDSGDMDLVQTIRDAHFKVKAPNTKAIDSAGNPIRLFHGEKDSPSYHDLRYLSSGPDHNGLGVYYSSNSKDIAKTYAQHKGGPTGQVREVYYNIENPNVVNAEGRSFQTVLIEEGAYGSKTGVSTDKLVNRTYWEKTPEGYRKKSDKDGLIIQNVEDHAPGWTGSSEDAIADNYVTWNPYAVKSAEAIVKHPNTGEIIPISKRDNFNVPSILMGATPMILGLGAAKTVSNSNTKEQQ